MFQSLGEGDILENELVDKLSKLVGFGNIAMHIYWRVDSDEVHRIITEEVEVLKPFAKRVESLIE